MTPIYRLLSDENDHFYCSTIEERERAIRIYGYFDEGVEFYAFAKNYLE